jgi:hypothetical protein
MNFLLASILLLYVLAQDPIPPVVPAPVIPPVAPPVVPPVVPVGPVNPAPAPVVPVPAPVRPVAPVPAPIDVPATTTSIPKDANPALGPVGPVISSETKPLLCGSSTSSSKDCEFTGDYCSFVENFDDNFRATDFLIYDGNPILHEFVVESGRPRIKDGKLIMPLGNTGNSKKSLASIVSTTRFLNFGSFEARMKACYISL